MGPYEIMLEWNDGKTFNVRSMEDPANEIRKVDVDKLKMYHGESHCLKALAPRDCMLFSLALQSKSLCARSNASTTVRQRVECSRQQCAVESRVLLMMGNPQSKTALLGKPGCFGIKDRELTGHICPLVEMLKDVVHFN